jgi:hypothetical protein
MTEKLSLDKIIFIALLVLAMIGVGITNFSPKLSHTYWLGMVVVFGIGALISGRSKVREGETTLKAYVAVHLLHWAGSFLAVIGAYTFIGSGIANLEDTGLMILLMLALATYTDGLRIGWRFSLAGLFLGATAVMIAYIDQFMWIALAVGIILLLFGLYWEKQRRRAAQ